MKRRVVIIYECGASDNLFKDKEEIGEERYKELTTLCPNGLACDGGGVPGEWCRGACHWEIQPDVEEDVVEFDDGYRERRV